MRILGIALIVAFVGGGCVFDAGGVSSFGDQRPAEIDLVGHDLTTDLSPPKTDAQPDGRDLVSRDAGRDQEDPDAPGPCSSGETRCDSVCVDLDHDEAHCGACGTTCGPPNTCVKGRCTAPIPPAQGCADGIAEQTFGQGMVGCAGKVTFPLRATLCALGSRVCSAAEWVARRKGMAPTYNYWTADALKYAGVFDYACRVSLNAPGACQSADSPMRVCAAHTDPLGNTCNWIGCGYRSVLPNQYFGGCNGNLTAGTLCCPK